jgi:uncharacterized cupredoxin-like copper-binding protein
MRLFTRVGLVAAFAAAALILTGCGGDKTASTASGSSRAIDVTMTDNAYQPTQLQVSKGETVTLRFKNTGMVKHEAIVGDDAMQMKHHDEMTASTAQMEHGNPGHAGQTSDTSSDAITIDPSKSGELTRTFNESGSILIGCHEPGHWEAGMKATVKIG